MAVLEQVVGRAAIADSEPSAAVTATPVVGEVGEVGEELAELTTVSEDAAVLFRGEQVIRLEGLTPDTDYEMDGVAFRTLPRPPGEHLATITTVNDVHFGEVECGVVVGQPDIGPIFRSAEGDPPYPELMNRAAVAEMAKLEPDAVVAKGDLTTHGTIEEYEQFLACYSAAFGDRLHHVRGNHDGYFGESFADAAPLDVKLPGVVLAIIDTVIPRATTGQVSAEQLQWLDDLAASADRPVLVFGHHHVWDPGSRQRPPGYFGINPDDSERIIDVAARRPNIVGYFAGHTHRNRARRFQATGEMPWVEVACVKDFPGAWAEYRIFGGGILQIVHRIAAPEAVRWTQLTRAMFGGLYPQYSFGGIADRCFPIWPR